MSLNAKRRRFVAEYLKDQNGTQAAIRAGYSPKTADVQAAQILGNLKVKHAVEAGFKKIEDHSVLTAEAVRADVLRLMQFDPRQAFHPDNTLKTIKEMPDSVAIAVAGIDCDDAAGALKRIRFIDRVRVLDLAAKILGMLKFQLTGKDGEPLVPPAPRIDFSGLTKDELKGLAMRHANGVSGH